MGWIQILRELRMQRGITLKAVSDAVRLTPGYLSQLERGQVSPSVDTLSRLSHFYRVPLSFLFEDDADGVSVTRDGSHFVLRPEEGGSVFQLLSPDLNRRIEFLRITIEPHGSTHSHLNTHPGEEVHYVLQGSLEAEISGRTYTLREGDSVYFQSTLPHRMRNAGSKLAIILTAMSPPTRWARSMLGAHAGESNPRAQDGRLRGDRKNLVRRQSKRDGEGRRR